MRAELALIVCLALSSACAADPFERMVAEPTMDSLQRAIDHCPRGLGARAKEVKESCHIKLPSGTIRGHWKIGGGTGSNVQLGVCLVGQGPGYGSTYPSGAPGAAGTTLVYDGPKGGTLLEFAGGDYPCMRDLTLAMDGAAVGVKFNVSGTTIQNPMLERVSIAGNRNRPAGIGLQITGPTNNEQIDTLTAHQLRIDDVDVGIEIDSNQSVLNRIGDGTKISAQTAAVRVRHGSLSLDGVLAQCRTANCCTYDLRQGHGYFRVRDGYHEIGLPPAVNAKLVCLSSNAPAEVGSWQMVSIAESYINVQCDSSAGPCAIDLLSGRSNVTVSFRDNWITSSGSPGSEAQRFARVLFSGPYGAPRLVWSGNGVLPSMGGIRATIGPGTRVEAFTDDGTQTWNDRNLNGRRDDSEPRM